MHEVLIELLALRADLQQTYQDPGFSVPVPTINFGCIHGGDNANRICGSCEIAYDFRILPGMDALEILDRIKSRIETVANGRKLRPEFETILEIVPPLLTPADAPIIFASERITSLKAGSVPFTTEAPFYRQRGLDVLVLGPGEISCAHQPDEYIRIDKLEPTIDVMAKLIHEFCFSDRPALPA
jgi:acetylornithine deacetylase